MLFEIYIYCVFYSNIYANGVLNYKKYKRLTDEGYIFIENNSIVKDVLELFKNSLEYFIPIYNVIKASYLVFNRDSEYEKYKDDCLLEGKIISKDDINKIKEIINNISDIEEDIYKEPIKSKILDIDVRIWKNMTEEERKELLSELLDVKKEKKKDSVIVNKLRKVRK